MKARKILALLLALVLCTTAFAGCSQPAQTPSQGEGSTVSQDNEPADEPVEEMLCRYVVPGTEPDDSPEVDAAITEKLKADGVNMKFERIYIPWDAWEQKVNLKMSTGDEFELIHIMEDGASTSSYVAKGGLAPIDDYLAQYGDVLTEKIPQKVWDSVAVNGKIYNIPVYFRDFATMLSSVNLPTHLFKKYNLSEEPKDIYEVIDSYATIIAGENDPDLHWWTKVNMVTETAYLRHIETYPFTVEDCMFFISNEGEVKPWLETEEFKEMCNVVRYAYETGVVHPDILTYPHEKISQLTEEGKNLGSGLYDLENIRKTVPEYEVKQYALSPEKPMTAGALSIMNANGVSATSPNPEAGVIFFNWLYASQENSDLLNYGIKDKHWIDKGDRSYELITDDQGVAPYSFGDWEMAHKDLVRITVSAPKELEPQMFEMNENAWISNAEGFKFDPEAVSAEYAACIAEIQASVFPLKYGVTAYDKGYESMIDAMNTAGYQKVVEEFKNQFEAWQANK